MNITAKSERVKVPWVSRPILIATKNVCVNVNEAGRMLKRLRPAFEEASESELTGSVGSFREPACH